MPLVKLDIIKGRPPQAIKSLADIVQAVLESHFNAPAYDRYQIITQHEPYEMICEDTGLGYQRTEKLVVVQIFQQGRSAEMKQQFYKELARRLEEECEVGPHDLIISCTGNEKEDWSFGEGRAQFLDGGL